MKFVTKLGLILAGSLVFGTTVATSTQLNPATSVSAKTVSSTQTSVKNSNLAKQGYTFKLFAGSGSLYKFNSKGNFVVAVKSNVVNQLIKKNTTFKITKVFTYKGKYTSSVMYYVVSKNGKYQGWVAAPSVYSSLTKNKKLAALVKVETRITNRVANTFTLTAKQKKQNAADLKLAAKLAKQVKGSSRTIAVQSVTQLAKFAQTGSSSDLPSIMWSVYYGA